MSEDAISTLKSLINARMSEDTISTLKFLTNASSVSGRLTLKIAMKVYFGTGRLQFNSYSKQK